MVSIVSSTILHGDLPGGSVVKNLPAKQKMLVWSLSQKIPWRRKCQPTPVFLPGKSHGQRILVGYSLRGRKRVGHYLVTKKQQQYYITYLKVAKRINLKSYSVQLSLVTQLCPTLCDPMNCIKPPCPSPTPGVHPKPCPLSWWCHPTISSSVIPFSSYPQSFPASGSFQMSQHFASGGQNIGVSASTSVLPMNTEDWSPLGWTDWIFLQSKGLSRIFSNTTVQKHQFFGSQLSL